MTAWQPIGMNSERLVMASGTGAARKQTSFFTRPGAEASTLENSMPASKLSNTAMHSSQPTAGASATSSSRTMPLVP